MFLIAGPCAIESRDCVMQTAETLRRLCYDLGITLYFKSSFDKANRTSASPRGVGLDEGLRILQEVKEQLGLPILTDVHESAQCVPVAEVADVLQIPAFLSRQTDLLQAAAQTGKIVNVKKGQFLAPEDMAGVIGKLRSAGCSNIMLTERGTTFGYHNLVVDMRSLAAMRALGVPVMFDATHSVQLPGGLGNASGGQRQYVPYLARAAAAVGIDALFLEVHPDPDHALSDGPNSLDFKSAEQTIEQVKAIHELTAQYL